MKIAVVGPTYPLRGGISHYTTAMVRKMRASHEVLLVSYRKQYPDLLYPGRTQFDDSAEPLRTDCEPLISFFDPLTWYRAAREIARFDPAVVVLSWVSPALAPQFRFIARRVKKSRPGTPVLFLCHNVAQHERRAGDALLSRFGLAGGDRFLVHSAEDRRNLLALLPGAAVTTVPLPAFDFFPPTRLEAAEARRELGLEPGSPAGLYFGFVRPYKGLRHLLAALPAVKEALPDFHLLVVGEFWESRDSYERELERLGVGDMVTVVDRYVPDEEVGTYFSAADVVVLPYVSATGSAIVQVAYGFSTPVISTRVGGIPEAVEEGVTGLLVEPGDPAALSRAIVEFFLDGPGADMRASIERRRGRFSWDSLVTAVEESAIAG